MTNAKQQKHRESAHVDAKRDLSTLRRVYF